MNNPYACHPDLSNPQLRGKAASGGPDRTKQGDVNGAGAAPLSIKTLRINIDCHAQITAQFELGGPRGKGLLQRR